MLDGSCWLWRCLVWVECFVARYMEDRLVRRRKGKNGCERRDLISLPHFQARYGLVMMLFVAVMLKRYVRIRQVRFWPN